MFRTDIAHEIVKELGKSTPGIVQGVVHGRFGLSKVSTKIATAQAAERIGKPIGNYCSIETKQAYGATDEVKKYIVQVLSVALAEFMKSFDEVFKTVLVVGLGNNSITADSLGPKVANALAASEKIKIFTPSVMGKTGIKSFESIKAISDSVKPDLVVIIDSLASRDIERVGTAFQINNTGIIPGSGVNAGQDLLSEKTLGVPVIAIGVPMVVYAPSLCFDTCKQVMGKCDVDDAKLMQQINRNISSLFGSLFVVPKDVDLVVESAAEIISEAMNIALN